MSSHRQSHSDRAASFPKRVLAVAILGAAWATFPGCAPASGTSNEIHESDPATSETTGTSAEALTTVTRSQAIAAAELWSAAKLQYCQAANGAPDYDTACSATCNRQHNTAWDPYRSDCSGLISWAWGLPAPGRVTSEFAPFSKVVSSTINCSDLKPGDAANRNAVGHIVLFKQWITPGSKAMFIEEPGCSAAEPYAHDFTSDVTCSGVDIDIAYEGSTFTAIRYTNIVDDPADAGASSSEADGGAHSDAGPANPNPIGDDAGDPAGSPNAGASADDGSGSGCAIHATRSASESPAGWGLALVGLVFARRRRRMSRPVKSICRQ